MNSTQALHSNVDDPKQQYCLTMGVVIQVDLYVSLIQST